MDLAERKALRIRLGQRGGFWVPGLVVGLFVFAQAMQMPAQKTDDALRQEMLKGSSAMSRGDFIAAISAYAAVTQMGPSLAEAHVNLGLALFQGGRLDDARPELEKALQLKPALRGANLFLGLIEYRQNKFKEAETYLKHEVVLDPDNPKAWMWLGVNRLASNDPQSAIEALNRAYELDPSDPDILYHRGHAYLLVANASYEAMFKLNSDSMRVHQVLAEAYAQSYRNQDAITEFETVVKMAPHQPGIHEELADQYWISGDPAKASANYKQELEIDPYSVTSLYKLGSLEVMNQNTADGVALLRKAIHADPSLADAHYYLGNGLIELGQNQDAAVQFREAIKADPKADRAMSAYYKLAQVYRGLHQDEQAKAAMENFLSLRAESRTRLNSHGAQQVHSRAELPVQDPEQVAIAGRTG